MSKPFSNYFFVPLFVAVMLVGCLDSSPEGPAASRALVRPPEPVTGRFAFQRMYIQARGWAPDAEPLRVLSFNLKEVASEEGKCGAWQATFVSRQLSKLRLYTFSTVESPGNFREGVVAGREESWFGSTGQARPFFLQALKIDSDEAFATAAKKSTDYLKKNPGKSVLFLLELTPRFPDPSWRVIWGETIGTSQHSVFVDATSGAYLQTL